MNINIAATFEGKCLQTESIVDGKGLRAVLWTQGCAHACKGCHNPSTHAFDAGLNVEVEEVIDEIKELKYHTGITLSGGDPLYQVEACTKISAFAKKNGLDVWCYTGFTFEQILKMSKKDKKYLEFLKNIDVLVDGKFEIEKLDYNLLFRGSKNQRLVCVNSSLNKGEVVLFNEYAYMNEKEESKVPVFI